MTSTKRLSMIFILTAILIAGGFTLAPYAYSTGYNNDDHDDDDDDCEREHYSSKGYDDDDDDNGKHSDDDDDDCEPDPCDCKKPDEFTVTYDGPGTEDNPAFVEIYKKIDHIGDKDPIVDGITVWNNDNVIVITASDFGKKKIGSNTAYRILWNNNPNQEPEQIAVISIHTSCSQDLYIGQVFTDGEVTLTVQDGKRNGKTSIPQSDPLTCDDDPPQPPSMASITVKKALTNDNDGDAGPEDFTVTLTDIGPDGLIGTADDVVVKSQAFDELDASFSVEIPVGTYVMTEDIADTVESSYTTVLVTGDAKCPSMVGEPFTLKKDKHITCTIYNDDNFVAPPPEDGDAGRIFHTNTIEFMYNSVNDDDGSFVAVTQVNGDPFVCDPGDTCIELDSMNSERFIIQDPNINKDTSLVVINIYALDIPDNQDAFAQKCVVGTLLPGPTPGTLNFTFECETIEGIFRDPMDTSMTAVESSLGKYRINYAVIDTLVITV